MSSRGPIWRRELTLAVAASAAAGGLGLLAGARPWVDLTVTRADPLPPAAATVTGGTAVALVPALALAVLAGAAGLLATRGRGRVLVGLIVLACGVGIVLGTLPWLTGPDPARAAELAAAVDLPIGDVAAAGRDGPYSALLAGALAALAGLATVLQGRRWPALGSRYDAPTPGASTAPAPSAAAAPQTTAASEPQGAPAAPPSPAPVARPEATAEPVDDDPPDAADPPASAAADDRALWDALDRGEDPTR